MGASAARAPAGTTTAGRVSSPCTPASHSAFNPPFNVGVSKEQAGDWDGAEAAYLEAVQLDPKFAKAHAYYGDALRQRGDLDGAEASCQEAVRLDPKDAELHELLGSVKKTRGDLDAALACALEALRLEPTAGRLHNQLGHLKKNRGDLDGAEAAYREALRLDPKYVLALANLAEIQLKQCKLDEAKQSVSQAITIEQKAHFYEIRGQIKIEAESYEDALQDYNEALGRAREQPEYLRRRAVLKELLAKKSEESGDSEAAASWKKGAIQDLIDAHESKEPAWIAEDIVIGAEMEKYSFAFAPLRLAYSQAKAPQSVAELKSAIKRMFQAQGSPDADSFFDRVAAEMDKHPEDTVPDAAQRAWTSVLTNLAGREPCSLWSECGRFTPQTIVADAKKAEAAAPVYRALNLNLTTNRLLRDEDIIFPPGGIVLRGSSLSTQHVGWFSSRKGKKIRMPNYFATAVESTPNVSHEFMCRNADQGKKPALWEVRFDKRGNPTDPNFSKVFVCKNVNLITKRVDGLSDEKEFLFVAYSVFIIVDVLPSTRPTPQNPHKVILEAVPDNINEDEDLPLAPWS